ncbi:MAG: sulfatase-like hydrolase/transferase [Planctomycetia bacterium]|nr:sulfatase-like hydrolase/transferase [Planctomycetia bacterium]
MNPGASRLLQVVSLLAAALALCASAPALADAQKPPPNVVFLLADDQRPDTIAALGNKHIQTPALDRLVESGFVFRHAYCMGSTVGAVCLPSRTMIMTGRTLFHLPSPKNVSADTSLFPRAMKRAGYLTLRTGKPENHPRYASDAFDRAFHVRRSVACSTTHADTAIAFIREKKQPFFVCVEFAAPHDPRVAPQEFMDRYQPGDVPLPPNFLPQHPFDNGEMTVRDEKLAPWPRTKEAVERHLAEYYADIAYLDHEIGRILDALRETGQDQNTLVVFASDHGLSIGSHGLFGKQSLYDDSMGAPLIFAGPGVPKGKSSDALVYLHDIFPTVCELAGAQKIPGGVEGKSLAPVMAGKETKVRDSVFLAYRDVQRAVRTDRWKLIRYPHVDTTQLFDVAADPYETKDLAADPAHKATIDELMELMRKWQKEVDDPAPLVVAQPKDPKWTPPAAEKATRE